MTIFRMQKTFNFYELPQDLKDRLISAVEGDPWGWEQNTSHTWDWYPLKSVTEGNTCWGLTPEDYLAFRDYFLANGIVEKETLVMHFSW